MPPSGMACRTSCRCSNADPPGALPLPAAQNGLSWTYRCACRGAWPPHRRSAGRCDTHGGAACHLGCVAAPAFPHLAGGSNDERSSACLARRRCRAVTVVVANGGNRAGGRFCRIAGDHLAGLSQRAADPGAGGRRPGRAAVQRRRCARRPGGLSQVRPDGQRQHLGTWRVPGAGLFRRSPAPPRRGHRCGDRRQPVRQVDGRAGCAASGRGAGGDRGGPEDQPLRCANRRAAADRSRSGCLPATDRLLD